MIKYIRYLLLLSFLPNLAMAEGEPVEQPNPCLVEPPVAKAKPSEPQSSTNQTIRIISDHSEAKMGEQAKFSGNVSFNQGSRHIAADEAILDQPNEQLDANGNLIFQDEMFTITADSLVAKMQSNSARLTGAKYWLHGQQIHGDAQELEITQDNNLHLSQTNFTTCPPGDNSWLLEADKIKIDGEEEWGELWGAKLRVADIPIFYIPYMTIPVTSKRKSGFLFPTFSTSTTNGIELAVPYYWNIAPEYAFTLTPHYMSARGMFLKSKFEYLAGDAQQGQLDIEYLQDDDKVTGSPNRHLMSWSHQGAINENWRVLANYIDVSDNNYFNDLSSDVQSTTDNQLNRIGEMSYLERNWNFSAKVQDIKVLGNEEDPYQVMPQLEYNYRSANFWQGLDFDLFSEATHFTHREYEEASATRIHLEPSISLPIHVPAGSLTSELKLLQTNYWQESDGAQESPLLEKTVNRTLPQIRVHGKMNFARDTSYFDIAYRQTLEPQIQYLYVGYQDQDNIGIYDSGKLQEDYYGLFRDRRFSGLDRIADANQITLGLTTKLFDSHNIEKMSFSLGQIFYLQPSRVDFADPNGSGALLNQENTSNSVLAAELSTYLYKDWYFGGSIQYDTKAHDNKKSEATLDFRPSTNKLLQFNYRYMPDLYNTNTNESVNISQTGFRGAWPINDNLYMVGNWYYDLNESRSVESYAGLQYESCCWAIRLSYHYHIKTNYEDEYDPNGDNRELFERGISLNLVIKGLGGSGPLGVSDMLNDGLFNYRKPLYLKN